MRVVDDVTVLLRWLTHIHQINLKYSYRAHNK